MTDQRAFYIQLDRCPFCGGRWRHYDGALGYESLICERCRFDIQGVKAIGAPLFDATETATQEKKEFQTWKK